MNYSDLQSRSNLKAYKLKVWSFKVFEYIQMLKNLYNFAIYQVLTFQILATDYINIQLKFFIWILKDSWSLGIIQISNVSNYESLKFENIIVADYALSN